MLIKSDTNTNYLTGKPVKSYLAWHRNAIRFYLEALGVFLSALWI